MKIVVLAAFIAVVSAVLLAQPPQRHVRDSMNDSLGTLARATTIKQLEKVWSGAPKDFPHRAVHAAVHFKLRGANSDTILINALPSNGKEMEALYDAQGTRQGQDMAVTDAYSTFYSAVSHALLRRPEQLPQFLRMIHAFHYVDNVDEWPWLCELASKVYDAAPQQYMRAVKQVEREYRQEALDCRKPPDAP